MQNTDSVYKILFTRNFPIIPSEIQDRIKTLKVLVAGCGSTGGAFIEGASRLGVKNFILAEPDTYDYNNLNRQFVFQTDVGKNKADVHLTRLKNLFQGCSPEIMVHSNGVTDKNIKILISNCDLVFDAVDVTTEKGMQAKLLLHEKAFEKKLIVLSALDLAYKQWIRIYDYRTEHAPLNGRLHFARQFKNPLRALIEGFCPVEEMSCEILEELKRLLKTPGASACQLASCCHLLAAFTGPILVRFAEDKPLPKLIEFDLMRHLEAPEEKTQSEEKRKILAEETKEILKKIA